MPEQETVDDPTQDKKPKNGEPDKQLERRPAWSDTFWLIFVILVLLWALGWALHVCGRWIHLLLAPILLALFVEFINGRKRPGDIESEKTDKPKWDSHDPVESLKRIFQYVVDEAGKSTSWYWRNKKWKARLSQFIRFLAWMLAAVGGLLPVIGKLFQNQWTKNLKLDDALWASLLLGIAAALLGLDKAFGYSSGWARYVLTATNIRKTLEEFRMDWAELMAKAGASPTPDQIAALIERARKFRVDVESLVLQETKDWVTEFQTSMAQMEKDVAAQLATLKAQVDKTEKERAEAAQPGAIQLTIQNSNKAAPGSLKVTLIDSSNQSVQESVTGSSWGKINLTPGQYQLKLDAIVSNQPVQEQRIVVVKAGQPENVQIAL